MSVLLGPLLFVRSAAGSVTGENGTGSGGRRRALYSWRDGDHRGGTFAGPHPVQLTSSERDELSRCYGEKQAEWIVLGAVMMGFLNKFMNTIGVELEPSIVADVSTIMGPDWSPGKAGADLDPSAPPNLPPIADGLRTKLRIVPLLPAALRLDKRWQDGVPNFAACVLCDPENPYYEGGKYGQTDDSCQSQLECFQAALIAGAVLR